MFDSANVSGWDVSDTHTLFQPAWLVSSVLPVLGTLVPADFIHQVVNNH